MTHLKEASISCSNIFSVFITFELYCNYAIFIWCRRLILIIVSSKSCNCSDSVVEWMIRLNNMDYMSLLSTSRIGD